MALGEWCSMAGEREGREREDEASAARERVVCVVRRWAFKRAPCLGLASPSRPGNLNLAGPAPDPAWLGLATKGAFIALAPALDGLACPRRQIHSAARAGVVCGLRRSQFSAWGKERAWALSRQACSVGHLHPAAVAADAFPAREGHGNGTGHVRSHRALRCISIPSEGR